QGARWRPPFMWALSGAGLIVALAALVLVRRGPRSAAKRVVVVACAVVAALPVTSWLIQLVPWWRWNALVLPLLLLAGSGAIAALATGVARRRPARALYVVTGAGVLVLATDLLTGSHL